MNPFNAINLIKGTFQQHTNPFTRMDSVTWRTSHVREEVGSWGEKQRLGWHSTLGLTGPGPSHQTTLCCCVFLHRDVSHTAERGILTQGKAPVSTTVTWANICHHNYRKQQSQWLSPPVYRFQSNSSEKYFIVTQGAEAGLSYVSLTLSHMVSSIRF